MRQKTLIIYDKSGTVLATYDANYMQAPVGVPYIIADVPDGVIIESVDVSKAQPIYAPQTIVSSEIDKLNAKMDYIAMMGNLDLSVVADVILNAPVKDKIEQINGTNETFSTNYVRVHNYYMTNLWSLVAVRNAVGKWINNQEFTKIVKAKEEQTSYTDKNNTIPTVKI